MAINFDEIYVIFRSRKVVSTVMMQHSATVCPDALEMFVAQSPAATAAAVDCGQTLSQGCVEPVVINTRPVILVSGRHMLHKAAAAVGSVVVIQHALPLSVECSAKLSSAVSTQNDSQSKSRTRHKRKRRRKNKVSYDRFKKFFFLDNLL